MQHNCFQVRPFGDSHLRRVQRGNVSGPEQEEVAAVRQPAGAALQASLPIAAHHLAGGALRDCQRAAVARQVRHCQTHRSVQLEFRRPESDRRGALLRGAAGAQKPQLGLGLFDFQRSVETFQVEVADRRVEKFH